MNFSTSLALKERIILLVKENPGMVRTEIRDSLQLPNNVVTPCIKELVTSGALREGVKRISETTGKPGHTLYLAEFWQKELDSQQRIFDENGVIIA